MPKERKPDAQIIALSPGTPPSSTAEHPTLPTSKAWVSVANFNPDLLDTNVHDDALNAAEEDSVVVVPGIGVKEGILGDISSVP